MNDEELEFFVSLIGRDTTSGALAAQREAQDACVEFLRSGGRELEVTSSDRTYPWTLVRTTAPDDPVLFASHIDTVPVGEESDWSSPPRDALITDGRLHGRGSVDMKAGLMASLVALRRAADKGLPAAVLLTSDEEIGLKGADAAANELKSLPVSLAVIGEPTGNRVCYGHPGVSWIEVHARGRAAHGSQPHEGENAIAALSEGLISRLHEFPAGRDDYLGEDTINLGVIRGGSVPNIVPDRAVATLDVRTAAGTGPTLAWLRGLDERLEVVQLLDIPPLQRRPAPRVLERFPSRPAMSGATDAAMLQRILGDAPIVVWGPGGTDQMHRVDESVELSQIDEAIENYWAVTRELGAS